MVEGLSSQSVRPLRGLTGEARSRPRVTVAGGPTVQSDTGQQLHPSRARHLHHDGRVMETAFLRGRGRGAGDLGGQGQGGLWLRQERAGGRGGGWVAAVVVGRGGAGCVCAAFRALLRLCGRCPCCADRVLVSCPLLCKTGDVVQIVLPVVFRSCSSWTGGDMPVVSTTGAVLGHG